MLVRDGGVIAAGYDDELDELRGIASNADQYLVELGPEVLTQLRHPNVTVRALATKAIERLKFYVDAKKALTGEK